MIHLIGNNNIIINLALFLRSKKIKFKAYSSVDVPELKSDFQLVANTDLLKEFILEDKSKILILSAGAPWIFNNEFLESFEPTGIFNIHGSLLPNDRGGTLMSWLIFNKKRLGNALIHKMVSSADAGPILAYKEFIYPEKCYYPEDYIKVYDEKQLELAKEICVLFTKNKINLNKTFEQPHYLSTYWPKLNAVLNSWINWSNSGEDIDLSIRAFDNPYKGSLTTWRGKKVYIKDSFFQRDNNFHPFQFGLIYRIRITNNIKYLAVAAKGGSLYIQSCVDENNHCLMTKIQEGDRFLTSDSDIFNAKKRTIKNKDGFISQKNI